MNVFYSFVSIFYYLVDFKPNHFTVRGLNGLYFPKYGRMELELWKPLKRHVYQRDKGKCKHCRKKVEYRYSHCHHIQPVGEGGSNLPKNLMTVCIPCHHKIHPFMKEMRKYNG